MDESVRTTQHEPRSSKQKAWSHIHEDGLGGLINGGVDSPVALSRLVSGGSRGLNTLERRS